MKKKLGRNICKTRPFFVECGAMRRLSLVCAVFFAILPWPLQAAGTAVMTRTSLGRVHDLEIVKYSVAWTSDGSGAVSGNAFPIKPGFLAEIRFTPTTSGTQPDDQYDATLVDSNGTISSGDLLSGTGANLSNSASKVLTFDPPIYIETGRSLDVIIANAGSAKTGTVAIIVQTQ